MASGTFQTTGRTTAGGERVAPQGASVSEIKGWMAIGDVATAWDVPLTEILVAFDLPADTGCRDAAQGPGERPVLGARAPQLAGCTWRGNPVTVAPSS